MAQLRNWTAVTSHRISAIDYDATTKTLYIRFNPNRDGEMGVYSYANVSPAMYAELQAAPSKGKWFSQIKDNAIAYPFHKIGVEGPEEPTAA